MQRGYVQVYTGDGKGKTTAAFGLAVRACGAGLRVYIGQFLKCGGYSEIRALKKAFPFVTIEQYGRRCFIRGKPSAADRRAAANGLAKLRTALKCGKYDLVVADEANTAILLGLITEDQCCRLIRTKPRKVELVFTGRGTHRKMIRCADLVTEMRSVKHYYDKGVKARRGIES